MKIKSLTIREPKSWKDEDTNYPYVAEIEFKDDSREMKVPIYGEDVMQMMRAALSAIERSVESAVEETKKEVLDLIAGGSE